MSALRWLRLVVARAYADRVVIVVAWLVILATVTLLSASVIYADAVGRSGLTARLARAEIEEANFQVRMVVPADVAFDADAQVSKLINDALGSTGGTIHRLGRSESFALPDRPADARDLAVLAFAGGLAERARLVSGEWPVAGGEQMEAALTTAAAERLGLALGDSVELVSQLSAEQRVTVRLGGIFEPLQPAEPFWWQDPLELDGVVVSGSFTTYGPLFVEREDLLSRALASRATLIWRVEPDIEAIDASAIGPLGAAVAGLRDRLLREFPTASVEVHTGLPALLAGAGSSLLVSRAGILLLDLQLGLLGLYALIMLSALIIEQRRADTALLRSRGASGGQLTALGLAEGALLVVPAVLLGPWLALALLGAFGSVGPLADIGVSIRPRLSAEALALAGAAGLISLIGLALPTLAAGGPLAGVRRMIGRQLQRNVAQRVGLDFAVLVVAGIALWQLNQYGTPLTRSLRGSLGVDPLLVAAPMIGLLAGALLSLRVLPLLALGVERVLARRRGPALGARQLARRPLRYTRAALLLIVAAAVTVFASAYGATSARSHHDQVDYAVGADVRLTTNVDRLDPATLDAALGEIEAVSAWTPAFRGGYRVGSAGVRGSLLALDAQRAEMVSFRPDLGDAPLAELLGLLPAPTGAGRELMLPPAAQRLAVDLDVALEAIEAGGEPLAFPQPWQGITSAAVLIDDRGLMYRVTAAGTLGRDGGRLDFELPAADTGDGRGGNRPGLTLVAIEPSIRAPGSAALIGELRIGGLWHSDDASGEDWQPLAGVPAADPAAGLAGWQSARLGEDGLPVVLEPPEALPAGIRVVAELPLPAASRNAFSLRAPGVRGSAADPLPALVNGAFLEQGGVELGDPVQVAEPFATPRSLRAVAIVGGFPTLDPDVPLAVVDYTALALSDYAALNRLPEPREFWLAAPEVEPRALRRALADGPLAAGQVLVASEELTRRLTDPLSVGTAGALVLGAIAALLFAAVGFLVNAAVGARERIVEFGLLQALGVSRRQLTRALALENGFLLGASLAAGIALGLGLAMIALPTATLTEQGGRPVPPATPVWPVEPLVSLLLLAVLLLLAALLLYRRWLAGGDLGTLLRLREE